MSKDARFWRNVILIAVAHIALLVGLIRWSLHSKRPSNAQSIVWIGGGENGGETKRAAPTPVKVLAARAEPTPLKSDEPDDEKPFLTAAKSEIQLPTPKPAATSTPIHKPTASPTPKVKATPEQTPKPTPKPNSAVKDGHAGGGSRASEFGWYGNMLHDRFYSAWIQPTTNITSGSKISTLVKVRIEKDGRVSNFEIIKPSENVVVNESVTAIAKRVMQVDPLPAGFGNGDHYDVKINFELSPE